MGRSTVRDETPKSFSNVGRRVAVAGLAASLALVGCSEPEDTGGGTTSESPTTTSRPNTPETVPGDGSIISQYAGSKWFAGEVPDAGVAADESLKPIKIGFMNIDSGPIAATPELHQATDAAVAFINSELGGVNGRPIEIVFCETDLGVDKAQSCAQLMVQEGVTAVLNGLNLSSGAAVTILEQNGIGWIGGIPLDEIEMNSPVSFHFSGGSPGAFAAFADHAANTLGAKRVSLLYTNVPQVADAALEYGVGLLEAFGVDVTQIPFDITTQDFATIVQRAAEPDPEAIIVGAADVACPKVMQAIADLEIKAKVYMVGSCADKKWIDQVGVDAITDMVFNIEQRIDQDGEYVADPDIYAAVIDRYGDGVNPRSAATVAFRSAMNLWVTLVELGDDPTPEGVIENFRKAVDRPSFDGHAFTCDGKQIPKLPSLCTAEEVLVQVGGADGTTFSEVSDGWIDVAKIVNDNL